MAESQGMAQSRVNFTAGRVQAFSCPPELRQDFIWDTKCPGLGLRATKGAKSYIFQGRVDGRSLRMTIGPAAVWDIAQAREEAAKLTQLVNRGIDPREQRAKELEARREERQQRQREAIRATVTLSKVWEEYVEARSHYWSESHRQDHDKAVQEPGKSHKRTDKKTVAGPLWELQDTPLASLSTARLREWLQSNAHRPTTTARAYRLLRACLHWASEQPEYAGLAAPSAIMTKSLFRDVPKSKPKSDVLAREQLEYWFTAVRRISDPTISAFVQTLLLTGARTGELQALKWEDVDFQWRSLHISDKVEGNRQIPLPPYCAHLLSRLPRRNSFVFASPTREDGPIHRPHRQHAEAIASAGIPHVSLHGLRRSFTTLAEWPEIPTGILAQIQGHRPSATAERHYKRRPLDLLRQWHDKLECWMLTQAGMAQPDPAEMGLRVVGGKGD